MGCYKNIIDSLRLCGNGDDPVDECGQVNCVCHYGERDAMCRQKVMFDAADAIEELLDFAKFVAREAIDTGDNDGVSAEILCRKLNKLGLIETDGELWMLPAPQKGVE